MKTLRFAVLAGLTLSLSACGTSLFSSSAADNARAASPVSEAEKQTAEAPEASPSRSVGDYRVYRFSGTFAKKPLVLSERVIAREKGSYVIDYQLDDGTTVERLRVRENVKSGDVTRVTKLEGDKEKASNRGALDAMLGRTVFSADINDGLIGKQNETCLVGKDELDCETKSYRVWIGDQRGTLSVSQSDKYSERDIAGQIATADGTVVYRSELVEAGHEAPTATLAARD
jgi:hypothetical protein